MEFLSLKRDCTGSSESTLVKIPHCWKSHVMAHLYLLRQQVSLPKFLATIHFYSVEYKTKLPKLSKILVALFLNINLSPCNWLLLLN